MIHAKPCSGVLKFDEVAYAAGKLETDTEVIQHDEKKADNGYTLICNSNGHATYLMDMKGRVAHQWDLPEGMMIWAIFMLLENGHLIRAIQKRGQTDGCGGKHNRLLCASLSSRRSGPVRQGSYARPDHRRKNHLMHGRDATTKHNGWGN